MAEDEEFQKFVKENRDLIERMMRLQAEAVDSAAAAGKEVLREAAGIGREAAEDARAVRDGVRDGTIPRSEAPWESRGIAREAVLETATLGFEAAEQMRESARGTVREAAEIGRDAGDLARERMERMAKATYDMINNPAVQKHFLAMGMEFIAGMSELMKCAPIPDFLKESATGLESNVRQSACKANPDCPSKASKSKKIDVDADVDAEVEAAPAPVKVSLDDD